MHGNKRNAIVRSWREGYRIKWIAREYRVSEDQAYRALLEAGIRGNSIWCREWREKIS